MKLYAEVVVFGPLIASCMWLAGVAANAILNRVMGR